MSIPTVITLETSAERRRDERWPVCLGARWLDARPDATAVGVVDLSASGFLVQIDRPLKVGTCLIVEMPGGLSKICKTVWNSGTYHGAQFSEPLCTAELQSLVASSLSIRVVKPDTDSGLDLFCQEEGYDAEEEAEERLPFTTSARLIVGATALLWALIGASLWLTTA
jgi:hypothetical protein